MISLLEDVPYMIEGIMLCFEGHGIQICVFWSVLNVDSFVLKGLSFCFFRIIIDEVGDFEVLGGGKAKHVPYDNNINMSMTFSLTLLSFPTLSLKTGHHQLWKLVVQAAALFF